MVAAATTSLPERAEQGRNYDYRYVWIRDQCYAGQAVAADGPHALLDDAVGFVAPRLLDDGPDLRPAYTARRGAVPDQRRWTCPATPAATTSSATTSTPSSSSTPSARRCCCSPRPAGTTGSTPDTGARSPRRRGDRARWSEPDAGIWELDNRPWTHSRLICAAGLRAMAALRPRRHTARLDHPGRRHRSPTPPTACTPPAAGNARPTTRAWTPRCCCPRCAAPSRPPTRAPSPPAAPSPPSSTEDGYVYRFRQDARPLGEAEGAFALCGFLMALAAAPAGGRRRRPPAGSNATGPPADRPGSTPRSSTSRSASCGATCRRPSCTP